MNERDDGGNTVWHFAAMKHSLKYIPRHLFTEEALAEKDFDGNTIVVRGIISDFNILDDIPEHLITHKLLHIKAKNGTLLFNQASRDYIDSIIKMPGKLNYFIAKNPFLSKEIEFRPAAKIERI